MSIAGTFLCDCGARLIVVTEGRDGSTAIACPTRTCKVRHIVSGEVTAVFLLDGDGKSVPYDWNANQTPKD
jgi:hypothetical protein